MEHQRMSALLFELCTKCKWVEASALVQHRPEAAQKLIKVGRKGASPVSALHVVLSHVKCRGEVPVSLVEQLLKVAPHMAKHQHNYSGNVPLHAVFYNAFFSSSKRKELTELILKAYPGSIYARNKDGRTPLHTSCSQHCNHDPIVVLLNRAPKIASWPDHNGDLPLHLACRSHRAPNKSIQALLCAYPNGLWIQNKDGLTPLDLTREIITDDAKKEVRISMLLQLCKAAEGKKRKDRCNAMEVVSAAVETQYKNDISSEATVGTRLKRKRQDVEASDGEHYKRKRQEGDLSAEIGPRSKKKRREKASDRAPMIVDLTTQDSDRNIESRQDSLDLDQQDLVEARDDCGTTDREDAEARKTSMILVAMRNGLRVSDY